MIQKQTSDDKKMNSSNSKDQGAQGNKQTRTVYRDLANSGSKLDRLIKENESQKDQESNAAKKEAQNSQQ